MATKKSITDRSRRNADRSGVLQMTPELFIELDVIARREARCALTVSTFEEMGSAWGQWDMMCGSGIVDVRKPYGIGSWDDLQMIKLADRIEVEKLFATKRPEMDWSAIPRQSLYHFVLFHEIGHKLHNFCPIDFMLSEAVRQPNTEELRRDLWTVNEALADRFAWQRLFPNKPLPRTRQREGRSIESRIGAISRFISMRQITGGRPLPTEPWAMVPSEHVISDPLPWFLGDSRDPSTRAGIFLKAWEDLPYFVGVPHPEGEKRISVYFPTLDMAKAERKNKSHRYPACRIYNRRGRLQGASGAGVSHG